MEPVAVALIRVLDPKGQIIPDLSLVRVNTKVNPGETAEPWVPYLVLVPPALSVALRSIFPKEYNMETVECRLVELGFSRMVLALYGPEPKSGKLVAPPAPAPQVGAGITLPGAPVTLAPSAIK